MCLKWGWTNLTQRRLICQRVRPNYKRFFFFSHRDVWFAAAASEDCSWGAGRHSRRVRNVMKLLTVWPTKSNNNNWDLWEKSTSVRSWSQRELVHLSHKGFKGCFLSHFILFFSNITKLDVVLFAFDSQRTTIKRSKNSKAKTNEPVSQAVSTTLLRVVSQKTLFFLRMRDADFAAQLRKMPLMFTSHFCQKHFNQHTETVSYSSRQNSSWATKSCSCVPTRLADVPIWMDN